MVRSPIILAVASLALALAACKRAPADQYGSILKDDGTPLSTDPTYWEWAASDQAPQSMRAEAQALADEEKHDEPGIADDSQPDPDPPTATDVAVALRLVDDPGISGTGGSDSGAGLAKTQDDPDAAAADSDEVIAETFTVTEGDIVDDKAPIEDETGESSMSLRAASNGLALADVFNRAWPGGNVPYKFAPGFAAQSAVQDAMQAWTAVVPSVHFRPAQNEQGYIYVTSASAGCFATIGYTGRQQVMNLGNGCTGKGTIMHELGHALGLHHEQKRQDASIYIKINLQNVIPGKESNFQPGGAVSGPYDYGSIMHYGMYAFSKNGQRTIEPTTPGVAIGQRNGPSQGDANALAAIYGGAAATVQQPTSCIGAWGYHWNARFQRDQLGTCRNPRSYCACWKNRTGNCNIFAPGAGAALGRTVAADTTGACDAACDQIVEMAWSTVQTQCNSSVILLNAEHEIEMYDYHVPSN